MPELLHQLAIAGCIVTMDAMGCQREIARQILDQGGEYVLALKDNQEALHDDVQLSVALAQQEEDAPHPPDQMQTVDKGHGRIETRRALVIDEAAVLTWLQERHHWPGLGAIGWVQAERRMGAEVTIAVSEKPTPPPVRSPHAQKRDVAHCIMVASLPRLLAR